MIWDPLGSRRGRLLAFFLLYVTEGIPLGFTATTVATQMRQQGVGAGDVARFVAVLYLPWAWKWVMGPVVDCVYSRRLGRRRAWIVGAQVLMALALLSGIGVDPVAYFKTFIVVVVVVNVFGAIQDVAIDALACKVLPKEERGLANGLMFAGAYAGQAVGGSLMLFLIASGVPFSLTFLIVPALILLVTVLIALPLREREDDEDDEVGADGADGKDEPEAPLLTQLKAYPVEAWRAFTGSRNALLALLFAALPTGGYALSLSLQANLAVEFGLSTEAIAALALVTTLTSGVCCAVGGKCSDVWGRRRVLGVTIALLAVPGILLAFAMIGEGWIMPIDVEAPDRRIASEWLITLFWAMVIGFAALVGFMYGVRTALFMDVCTPAVAATQFTAYMAILNLVISYTGFWHGKMIDTFGYPATLFVDAGAGLLCLIPLALMRHVGPTLKFRRLEPAEAEAGFALLQEVARWLDGKGRRQRIAATPYDAYLRWHAGGDNWGVFDHGELVAIFTVVREPLHDWPDIDVSGPVPWLRALAVHPSRRGDGVGAEAIRVALAQVATSEHLYLDCVSDFLPEYYAEQGFEHVARQVRAYPDGEYDITLMRQPGRRPS